MSGELLVGMMSGTSVDGIDASLVRFHSDSKLEVIATHFIPFRDKLRAQITHLALNSGHLTRRSDSPLHTLLASNYAEASLSLLRQAKVETHEIAAIANHGQTVRHEPTASPPFSLQLGDPQQIANLTGIPTISQFRQADLAAGGQGAPLMPAFHKAVLDRSSVADKNPSFVLNLGGIANITRLEEPVIGFDTGPANTLLDQWIEKHEHKAYDANGGWARGGKLIPEVLEKLLSDPYIEQPFPKSTGTDYFNLEWLHDRVSDLEQYQPQDIQTTLLFFTVESIASGLAQAGAERGYIYVCGGGASNAFLIGQLKSTLSDFTIKPTDELGVPSDWVEAVGFAWLGYRHLHNIASNLPSVTGANRNVVLGEIFEPN